MTLLQIIAATTVISLIAFVGILTFFLRKELLERALLILVALSTGALLGGAFLHLIPETIAQLGGGIDIFLVLLLGFSIFFILEQFLQWHHHHSAVHGAKPFSYLILISDGVHNFIDGLIIAASFVTSYQIGIVTTLAVALHEIPQELGDFGVLVYGGFSRKRALIFNFISALTAIVGGIAGYFAYSIMHDYIVYLLPFAAGNFIYIAAADLIPEIKHQINLRRSLVHFAVFLVGIGIMLVVKFIH